MAVKLSVMVEGLKWVCGHDTVYVNIKKNTLVNIADQSMSDLPSDHAILEIEENKDDYIELPSYKQIDFKKIANNYVDTLSDGAVKTRLEKALKGFFPMKKFLKEIQIFEYNDNWYNYRTKALKTIAINFLNMKNIEYEDDISY
jgi:hypothetical protein